MTLTEFVKKRKYLFWYTRNWDRLSKETIVEGILNYGDWEDVKVLMRIVGIKETERIFRSQARGPRNNYRPEIKHYFNLYFKKHA